MTWLNFWSPLQPCQTLTCSATFTFPRQEHIRGENWTFSIDKEGLLSQTFGLDGSSLDYALERVCQSHTIRTKFLIRILKIVRKSSKWFGRSRNRPISFNNGQTIVMSIWRPRYETLQLWLLDNNPLSYFHSCALLLIVFPYRNYNLFPYKNRNFSQKQSCEINRILILITALKTENQTRNGELRVYDSRNYIRQGSTK